jgi:hypothetical protein
VILYIRGAKMPASVFFRLSATFFSFLWLSFRKNSVD